MSISLLHAIPAINFFSHCAQVVKSLRASPVMAHAVKEVADMSSLASTVVLNIVTLTEDFVESMKKAAPAASCRNIPVILDVCGAGATPFRDKKSFEILDAAHVGEDLVEIAAGLAKKRACTVVVTGKEDIVTDGARSYRVRNGVEFMSQVVGTGCMAISAVVTRPDLTAEIANIQKEFGL